MISTVLIGYNAEPLFKTYLSTLVALASKHPLLGDIIIVDDGSTDFTVEYVQTHFEAVRLIQNSTYLGYARSLNRALDIAKDTWALVLDVDTSFASIDMEVLNVLIQNAQLGMACVNAKTYLVNCKHVLSSNGFDPLFDPFTGLFEDMGYRLKRRDLDVVHTKCIQVEMESEIPYVYTFFTPKDVVKFDRRNRLLLSWTQATRFKKIEIALKALWPFFTFNLKKTQVVVMSVRALMRLVLIDTLLHL